MRNQRPGSTYNYIMYYLSTYQWLQWPWKRERLVFPDMNAPIDITIVNPCQISIFDQISRKVESDLKTDKKGYNTYPSLRTEGQEGRIQLQQQKAWQSQEDPSFRGQCPHDTQLTNVTQCYLFKIFFLQTKIDSFQKSHLKRLFVITFLFIHFRIFSFFAFFH